MMQLLEPTQLIPGSIPGYPAKGMWARPLTTGMVLLETHYSADPIGHSPEMLEARKRKLGGMGSWKWRKEMELDFNAQSGESVFDPQWLDAQTRHVAAPILRMEVAPDGKLYEKSDGRVRIWIPPDRMPRDLPSGAESARMTFGMGMDVGAGTGQSDSTIEGFAVQGMEQAFEWNSNTVPPAQLGRLAAAIARFYNNALICCVQKMHGITAIRAMLDAGYTYLWRNVGHDKMIETSTGGRIGWVHGENSDALLMDRVNDALGGSDNADVDVLSSRGVIVHSQLLLEQLRQYVYDESGRPVLSKYKVLNTMARKQHGDCVVGTALGIRACMDLPPWRSVQYCQIVPKSAEWYRQQWLAEQQKVKEEAWRQ